MCKFAFTFVFSLLSLLISGQSNESSDRLTYAILAPNGSVAITITDDSKDNTIKLESVDRFYKYQLLDTNTSEPVFSSFNNGKECTFDKSKVAMGIYKLRLYTRNFIITSKITVSTPIITETTRVVAMSDL